MIHIGEVHAEIESRGERASRPPETPPPEPMAAVRERLRPIVLEILADEIERLRRRHG